MKLAITTHGVAGTLASFAAVVAVSAAQGPSAPPVPSTPARTAVVVSAGLPVPAPAAARIERVTGGPEAQAAVLRLVAHGYTTVIGVGPEARAAVELARAGEARDGVRLIGR